jgi:hypothetical protein
MIKEELEKSIRELRERDIAESEDGWRMATGYNGVIQRSIRAMNKEVVDLRGMVTELQSKLAAIDEIKQTKKK